MINSFNLLLQGIVNEKELSVAERIHALELHGPRSMREELPWLRWDMALDLIPEIAQMRFSHKGWDPQLIVAISLPNCGLTNIAVIFIIFFLYILIFLLLSFLLFY